jgi:hypothetical protein
MKRLGSFHLEIGFSSIAVLLLLLLLLSSTLLFLPLVSASTALSSANAVNTQKGDSASYEIYSSIPGSTLKAQANWNVPSVTCNSSTPGAYMQFYVVVGHISAEDSGTWLQVSCSGLTPQYSLTYFGSGISGNALPPGYTVSAGDHMQTFASVVVSTGLTSTTINDLTKGWKYSSAGFESIDTKKSGFALWFVAEPGGGTSSRPLLQFSTIKVGNVKATVGGHSGVLGSFVPLQKLMVYKFIFVDTSNNHALAKPTPITSTSSSFKINWIQGS